MGDFDETPPRCPRCDANELEPAGEERRPYWWCPDCGVIRIVA